MSDVIFEVKETTNNNTKVPLKKNMTLNFGEKIN